MADFFGNFNKTLVGIAVTQNVGLEVAVIDKKTSQMIKYATKPLDYNIATREIDNYTIFKNTLIKIYTELGIELKHDAYIVLPNVHFDFTNLPVATMDSAAISEHLAVKIEESNYIFRRVDPMTDWDDVNFRNRTDSRYVVHSSIQVEACEQVKNIVQELGGNVIGIEGSYSAILRGIDYSGVAAGFVETQADWHLLLINSNSYAMFEMQGNNLVDYSEYPLALKSFSVEEAYQAITNPVKQLLDSYVSKNLLIVSQSDEISAEVLRTSLYQQEGEILAINSNKFNESPVLVGEATKTTSFSIVGACCATFSKFPLKLNVLFPRSGNISTDVELFGKIVSVATINKVCLILAILIALAGGAILGGLFWGDQYLKNKNAQLESEVQQLETELKTLKANDKGNINTLFNDIIAQNVKTLKFYNSLAVDIPKTVWLSHFASRNGDQVYIEGMSGNIKDVYEYYKSLKIMVPSSNMTLSKLKMVSNMFSDDYSLDNFSDNVKLYSFAIGSPIDQVVTAATDAANAQGGDNNQQGQNAQNNNPAPPTTAKVNSNTNSVDSTPPDVNLQPINDDMFK